LVDTSSSEPRSGVRVVARSYADVTAFDLTAALETAGRWWADPAWRPTFGQG